MTDPTVLAAFIGGVFALVAALVSVMVPKLHRQGRDMKTIREQVQNSHGTNLRDDLDFVRDLVLGVHEELKDMRTDIAWERRERADLTRRVELVEEKV